MPRSVDGENSGENMNPGYDDADGATDGGGQTIDGPDGANDTILGNGGNDTINAGVGDDLVSGGSGDDVIDGGVGNDTIYGDAGDGANHGGENSVTFRIESQNGAENGNVLVEITGADGTVTTQTAVTSYDSNVGNTFTVDLDAGDTIRIGITDSHGTPNWSNVDSDARASFESADTVDLHFEDANDSDFNDVVITASVSGDVTLLTTAGPATGAPTDGVVVDTGDAGDDTIDGGAGDDVIYGDNGTTVVTEGPNLVINGSFEDTTGLSTTGYGYNGTEGEVPGWTDANGVAINIHADNRGGVDPTDGDNWADLGSSPGDNRIGQDIAGLNDGDALRLTFDVGDIATSDDGTALDNTMDVIWGGEVIASIDPSDGSMENYTFDLVAGAGDGSDRLEFEGGGRNDNYGVSLDSVELYAVTEEGGDDVITGGDGADSMFGQAGDDTFVVGSATEGAGDVITGGNGPDDTTDFDVLDLRGAGQVTIDQQADADDAGATEGTVTFADGSTLQFNEIEQILTDPENQDPTAVEDTVNVDEDESVTFNPAANDTDPDAGDALEVLSIGDPDNGTLTDNGDGTYTFVPDENFNGTETIEYTVSDGNGGTDTGTITFNVAPVNDAPDAVNDVQTTVEDTPVVLTLLDNDTDPDTGDALSVISATVDPSEGTVELVDGVATFTPADNFNGDATITYTVSDGNGLTDTADHVVTVTPDGDAPVAVDDDAGGVVVGDVLTFDPRGNDSDPDGDPLSVTAASVSADQGSVEVVDNQVVFTPNPDFEGDATITYEVQDPDGNSDTADITVFVRDGVITGTDDGELIDDSYTGDPGNDLVDNDDNVLSDDPEDADDDIIVAGGGNDTVIAGDGDDQVDGGTDDDDITTGDGSDTVRGGDGDDVIRTGNGDLEIDAGYPGLFGGEEGTAGAENDRDLVDGGDGNDTITTGDDRDTITGGDGDDVIDGGIDDDEISGDEGDDRIVGGEGDDDIQGGSGNDTIYAGNDPVLGLDALNIEDDGSNPFGPDLRPDNGRDTVSGGEGDDVIYGADDGDVLSGDAGDDFIDGEIDDDTIEGGSGNDTLIGGQGNDSIDGGSGDDRIDGGDGTDMLSGGDDRDTFTNVNAGDVVDGGEGVTDTEDFDTLDLSGSAPINGSLQVVYDDSNPENGVVNYFDEDGNAAGELTFTNIENVIPCFTPGTLIATAKGERRVEDLMVGDRIITRDNGIQEISWIGSKAMSGRDLLQRPEFKPILVKAGSLASGIPERDMMLSPNHKVLWTGDQAELYFEQREVLVAAKHLIGMPGVQQVNVTRTSYIHFMFEQHEVVLSDGAWTESFHPGDYSLNSMDNAAREEIIALFPELATEEGLNNYRMVRTELKKHEVQLLIS